MISYLNKSNCTYCLLIFITTITLIFPVVKPRVAILDFVAKGGVSSQEAEVTGELIRNDIVNCERFEVLDRANMDNILKEIAFQQTGCTETACAVQVGKLLNMEYMFYGSLMKLGSTYYITMGMVDIETGRVVKSAREESITIDGISKTIPALLDKFISDVPLRTSTVPKPVVQIPSTGKLIVVSEPQNASVYTNGIFAGVAPLSIETALGKYVIAIWKENYKTNYHNAVVSAEKYTTIRTSLLPREGVLKIASIPSEALVYLNDVLIGKTPIETNINEGSYACAVKADGYMSYQSTVEIKDGEKIRIDASLKKLGGVLRMTSTPSGAGVYIDGNYIGMTPLERLLPEGGYLIEVKKPSYATFSSNDKISSDKTNDIEVTLNQTSSWGLTLEAGNGGILGLTGEYYFGSFGVGIGGMFDYSQKTVVDKNYSLAYVGVTANMIYSIINDSVFMFDARMRVGYNILFVGGELLTPVSASGFEITPELLVGAFNIFAIVSGSFTMSKTFEFIPQIGIGYRLRF